MPNGSPILSATIFAPQAEAAEALLAGKSPDRQAIRALILNACHNMILLLTQDDTVNLSKFISREQLAPTAAYHLIHQQVIAPLHHYLTRLDCRLDRPRCR
ncbi:TetR family transcriptional regulator [Klebsiella variicola]|uniref:TetR family transcriptional regulator n=1 Tax=Klebsiella variicola TaxID=244366 RepID=A0A7H4MG93_KLEVA|nr:TetR family transcriptional regulator [Klebsiella variicola]